MAVNVTYPGVYVVEVPSGVRTIAGVETSIAAFVGYTGRGPTNAARQIFNFGDFERTFGGLHRDSLLGYAVQHFYLNGGGKAWVVRVAQGAARASVGLRNGVGLGAVTVLTATAKSEGLWGNALRLDVDYDTANPASLFNLTVTEFVEQGGVLQPARSEVHRNLGMSRFGANFAVDVVNATSELIDLTRPVAAVTAIQDANGTSRSGALSLADTAQLGDDRRRLAIIVDGDGPHEFDLFDAGGDLAGATLNDRLDDLAARIQAQVRALDPANAAFANFTCARDEATVVAISGTPNGEGERSSVRFLNAGQRNAALVLRLGLANGGRETDATSAIRPLQTGTVGGDLAALDLAGLSAPAAINITLRAAGATDDGPHTFQLWATAAARPTTLEGLRSRIAAALATSGRAALNQARLTVVDQRLRLVAGGNDPNVRLIVVDSGADTTATDIGLAAGDDNIARYALGVGATAQAQTGAVPGDDGGPPSDIDLRGSRAEKSGLFALEDVDLFNILCLPGRSDGALLGEAIAYAEERRAFMLVDLPDTIDTLPEAQAWLAGNGALRHRNVAAYFPRIRAADPLQNNRIRAFPNCGAVAGLYARTDGSRGVWKAPAGTEASLRGVQALDYTLTDPENGVLNPLGLNCLRNFPAFGPVVWGARTLVGSDQLASEWKYIPVRRLALFLEESLYRGTQWVVFEPNDEPLWAQIRLNVGAFMNTLFRQGAFQGRTPQEAYLVKCDRETTTQNDIDRGIVNIVVGFAPLKPAEFVIIRIQQLAGQIQV
ncbi:MAG: phage tail sheath family protein [Rhodospirillales bacterium]